MRAILSVSDTTGLVELARGLTFLGVELFSTGGTMQALAEAGLAVRSVYDLTGFPEILDGRVKTLHPAVHAGILARRDRPEHMEALSVLGLETIDIVICNLYPFIETVTRPDVSLDEALENIDIGGPTLIRAAAKNFPSIIVLVDPADYGPVLAHLQAGGLTLEMRQRLAQKAFQHVALYDTAIAEYLRGETDGLPQTLTIGLHKRFDLRYGENPHQRGALYRRQGVFQPEPGIAGATQLHGKELSYVNILDADAAWQAVCDFEEPTVVIVKHMTPCGIATRDDLCKAFELAFMADPVSAFGGIIAINRPVDAALAEVIRATKHPTSGQRLFVEIIVAPDFTSGALEQLRKSRDLRILRASPVPMRSSTIEYRGIVGGMLVQEADRPAQDPPEMRVVTKRAPTAAELEDLRYAWRCVKHVKSNAIVLVKDCALIGVGTGQPNRVTSARLAVEAAGPRAAGAVCASEALIPFADTVEVVAAAGVTALAQTGGSIRDEEVIAAADAHTLAMVFTGIRHFRH